MEERREDVIRRILQELVHGFRYALLFSDGIIKAEDSTKILEDIQV